MAYTDLPSTCPMRGLVLPFALKHHPQLAVTRRHSNTTTPAKAPDNPWREPRPTYQSYMSIRMHEKCGRHRHPAYEQVTLHCMHASYCKRATSCLCYGIWVSLAVQGAGAEGPRASAQMHLQRLAQLAGLAEKSTSWLRMQPVRSLLGRLRHFMRCDMVHGHPHAAPRSKRQLGCAGMFHLHDGAIHRYRIW